MPEDSLASGFTEEKLETWAALATLLEWLPAALDTQLKRDSDLTHFEYGVLFALCDAPEGILRMSVLAGYSNSSLSRLSRAATRLERSDWMRRYPDPTDGRSTLARVTELGRRKIEQATPGHADLVNRLVFDSLSQAQTKQLLSISRRVTTAIRSEGDWRASASSAPAAAPAPPRSRS